MRVDCFFRVLCLVAFVWVLEYTQGLVEKFFWKQKGEEGRSGIVDVLCLWLDFMLGRVLVGLGFACCQSFDFLTRMDNGAGKSEAGTIATQ